MSNNLSLMMLQPGYLPWIGFFEQVYKADIFVVYDDAQYTKQDWRNRNRIKKPDSTITYITVPIKKPGTQTVIKDIKISYEQDWVKRHINILDSYYAQAPFFKDYFGGIRGILEKKHQFILDLDMELIMLFMDVLNLEKRIIFSSQLKTAVRGKDRLLAACRELGAGCCYNGKAGQSLYNTREFYDNGVILEFQDFNCPEYHQLWGGFIPNLSVIDLIFNCGNKSMEIISQAESYAKKECAGG